MRAKTFLICLVLAVCLMCLPVICAADTDDPGPVVIETTKEVTESPTDPVVITTEPTTKPTAEPTTERTTEPTTEKTTEPTTEPTTERTTVMTTEPTAEPTTIPTTIITVGGDHGWVDVYCNVDGATVYFDGVPKGTTAGGILSVEVATQGTPISTITVTKSGYTTWSGSLTAMPGNDEHVSVYATINPIATPTTTPPVNAGSIYVESNPSGAAIYMDGVFEGYSPMTISQIAPGSYQMKATLSGYSSDSSTVVVYSGQTSGYYPNLQASPSPHRDTGTVYVTSSPSAASIYIDGNYYGKTPLTVTLYPGTHNIVLKMSGYNDYSTTVYVYANQAQNLPVTMTTAVYGTVVFTSLPGAAVYMDSNYAGQISSA
ncbi:MAG: PEGA domain-containing protein, partial [Methanoregula sp.]